MLRIIHRNPYAETGYVESMILNAKSVCTTTKDKFIEIAMNSAILPFREKLLNISTVVV